MDWLLDHIEWLIAAIITPIIVWLANYFRSKRKRKREREAIIKNLCGLPPESKTILIDFYHRGTHTMRGDPYAPAVEVLVSHGIMVRGPGGGSYNAVNRYLTIRPHIWEVMDDWASVDGLFFSEILAKETE